MDHEVTVVVPAYNNAETVRETLASVLSQKFDGKFDVLIVDDHSTDGTKDICESAGVKVFENPTNRGLAASLNRGIQSSTSKIIVTLHADAVPLSENWLAELVESLGEENVGATCSLQYSPNIEKTGFSLWEKFLWGKVLPHHALNNKADAYRREVLDKIGLFDEQRFRTAGEDEDMGLRLRLHGWVFQGTQAEILHNHRFGQGSGWSVFGKIIKKEYTFGRAGGALRRKFPIHTLGAFVYPDQKSLLSDGAVRVCICFGCLVPYLQWICIPSLAIMSLTGFRGCKNRTGFKGRMAAYPFFNAARYWCYSFGYLHGLISGNQR